MSWTNTLTNFILQANTNDLKINSYPKEWSELRMKVSFGMGAAAKVPWIAFLAEGMQVSNGINPIYLYYKEEQKLILAYGISETNESAISWPAEIINSTTTISAYFDKAISRYGDSFVFKAYNIKIENGKVVYLDDAEKALSVEDLESDLEVIISYYKKTLSITSKNPTTTEYTSGLFYMEKELENFIIENWEKTEFGKKYDLIIEEGVLKSQQYRTEIGPIDILVKDKINKNFVVIELKRNQTSDDTIGQLARYMGWIREVKGDKNVKGIIIAGNYDKKLDYALKMMPNVDVFIYEVDFHLKEFTKLKS